MKTLKTLAVAGVFLVGSYLTGCISKNDLNNRINYEAFVLDINGDGIQDIYIELKCDGEVFKRELGLSSKIDGKYVFFNEKVKKDSELYKRIKEKDNQAEKKGTLVKTLH